MPGTCRDASLKNTKRKSHTQATGRVSPGEDGPIAKLGWVLSGPVPAIFYTVRIGRVGKGLIAESKVHPQHCIGDNRQGESTSSPDFYRLRTVVVMQPLLI